MEVNKEQSLTDAVLESRRRYEEESVKKLTDSPEQSASSKEIQSEPSEMSSDDVTG